MKKISITIMFCLLAALFVSATSLAAITDIYDKGEINWEQNIIRVIGMGTAPQTKNEAQAKLLAVRAAKVDAMRNALEIIENVRVNSSSTMEMMMLTSDKVMTSVQGYVKGGIFEEPTFDPSGICTITYVLPISGQNGISPLIVDLVKAQNPQAISAPIATTPEPAVVSAPVQTVPYTGIIIDARSVNVKPALYPQIFDSEGYLLYGPTMINAQQPDFTTMAAYSRSLEKAAAMERVGRNPLQLTAASVVKAENGEPTDLILGSEAAKSFRNATLQSDILNKSAVVIIIN